MAWRNQQVPQSSCGLTSASNSASRILSSYELSDDLVRKHVQALERKYGGGVRAHSAAIKIQRAFRHFKLQQQFQAVCHRETLQTHNFQNDIIVRSVNNDFSMCKNNSQPTIKYQAANSLRAQLFAERTTGQPSSSTIISVSSPRKNSTPTGTARDRSETAPNGTQQRAFLDLMSPRLSQRHAFAPSNRGAAGTSPSIWIPQRQACLTPSPPSVTNSSQHSSLSDGTSHMNYTNSLPRLDCGRRFKSVTDCRPGMPDNGNPAQFPVYHHLSHNTINCTQSASSSMKAHQRVIRIENTGEADVFRRRHYRIALNFFNKKPDRGLKLLIDWGFVDDDPYQIAKFITSRRGLSKQMTGEFLGTLRSSFHAAILQNVLSLINMENAGIDSALRTMLHYFRLPSEAQKIDYVMQAFAHRYRECNAHNLSPAVTTDAIYILAFATIMLNTDLHSPSMKESKKMTEHDFVKNTYGAEESKMFTRESLIGIYNRVKENEIRAGSDHLSQVVKVDQSIVGKDKPHLVEQHRRLICYCRLNQVLDINKKQSPTVHLREIFLFNDVILITKNVTKRKNVSQYSIRVWSPLLDAKADAVESPLYKCGLKINLSGQQPLFFNAKNEDDRMRFLADLKESIAEQNEMEKLRLKLELEKQRERDDQQRTITVVHRTESQRDSGVPDLIQSSPIMTRNSDSSLQNQMSSTSSTESSTPLRSQSQCYASFSSIGNESVPRPQLNSPPSNAPPHRRLSFNSLDSGVVEESTELSI